MKLCIKWTAVAVLLAPSSPVAAQTSISGGTASAASANGKAQSGSHVNQGNGPVLNSNTRVQAHDGGRLHAVEAQILALKASVEGILKIGRKLVSARAWCSAFSSKTNCR